MFGNALDSMISQYSQYRAEPTNAPVAAPTPTTAPTRFGFDVGGGGFAASPSNPSGGSFFSAASPITAGGNSTGFSPFGQGVPDLSKADPATLARLTKEMSGLIYSLPGGGYIHADYGSQPGEKWGPYYKGESHMTGNDASANSLAKSYFNFIGSLPTRPLGTQALNTLPGYTPRLGPSLSDKLGQPYGGPFAFPGWGT